MSERKKGNVVIFGFVGLIVLTAVVLGVLVVTAPGAPSSDSQSPEIEGAAEPGMVLDEDGNLVPYAPGRADEGEAQPPADVVDERTPEERAADAVEAARELVGGDPVYCESPCDCPQGQDCQPGAQLCMPSPFPVYCCENDGCPAGNSCVSADGSFGVCGE